MGEIHSAFTLDYKPMASSLEKAKQHVESTMSDIEKSGMGVEEMLGKIGKMAGAAFAAFSAQQFISQVMDVRKEFQSLEVSFTTLLGSAEKGKKMFQDITKFATSTPMLEKDLASGAQTLLGFNIEAEKVLPILQQVGDISMGDSQKFQSLILAFAQASSTGKLMGQDLLQMINAGFNPLAEISRTTGRSLKDLKEDMSNGKITVEMLQGAFKSATSEGGKFNGMLESMSHTIEGAQSNLEGAIQKLMNDVGQEIEKPIIEGMTDATEAVNYFAEHIDTLAAIVKGMVAVFGVYKTACVAVTVANNAAAASEGVYSVATTAAYVKTMLLTKAQALLNATMLANPYVLAATLLTTLVATMVIAENSTDAVSNAQKTLNKELSEAAQKEQELKDKMDKYIQTCNDDTRSTEERQQALQNLYKYYPNIISKYVDEEGHLKNILALKREINAEDNKRSQTKLRSQSNLMQQYADVMRKVANSKNGTADLSASEKATYDAANAYYSDNNSWLTVMGSGAKDKASYFANLAKGYNREAGKKSTEQSITKFENRLETMGTADLKRFKDALEKAKGKLNGKIKMVNIKGFGLLDESQVNMLLDRVTKQHDAKSGANSLDKAYEQAEKNYRAAVNKVDKIEANRAKYTTTEYTKAKEDLKAAEEELKKYGGKTVKQTASAAKSAATAAARAAKENAKNTQALADLDVKQTRERSRAEADAELEAQQYTINAMAESSAKKVAQINLDYEREREAIKRGIEDTKLANENAVRELWEKQNPNASKTGATWAVEGRQWASQQGYTFDLTDAQQKMYDKRAYANEVNHQRQFDNLKKTNDQYRTDYLKQFGSIEQQRLAITEETERKIAELRNQGASEFEIASVQQQAKQQLDKLNSDDIFNKIDWDNVFSDLQGHTQDYLISLRDQLMEVLKDGSVKSIQDIEKIQNKITEINGEISKKGGLFNFQSEYSRERQRLKANVTNAVSNVGKASTDVSLAQLEYNKVKEAYDKGKASADALAVAEAKLNKARQEETNIIAKLKQAIDAAKTDTGKAIAGWFEGAQEFISDNGIDQLPTLFNQLGMGDIGEKLGSGLSGFNNASGAVADFVNQNYIGAAIKAISAITDFGDALGIGNGSNAAEVAEITERNTKAIDSLTAKIEDLTEAMDESSGATAVALGVAALEAQRNINAKTVDTLSAQMAYHGDHHSNNQYINNTKLSALYAKEVNYALNLHKDMVEAISGYNDIYAMTAEQIAAIKAYMPETWDYLTTAGYYDKTEYWEDVVEQAGKLEDISEAIRENITGTTFDSFKDSFLNTLMDMDASVGDFADDMTEQITQALLKAQIDKELGDDLKAYYEDWYEKLNKGTLSDQDRESLRDSYTSLVERAQAIRDDVAEITGYDVSSSEANGTVNAAKSMTEDTANELVGRITAVQLSVEGEKVQVALAVSQLTAMTSSITDTNRTLSDIRDLQQTSNEYLADITKYTKAMYEGWDDKVNTMTEHLKQL